MDHVDGQPVRDGADAPAAPLAVRLRAMLPSLHPAEERVARVFLDHHEGSAMLTIADVAERADTSTATVVRLFQRLDHRKFKTFWLELTHEAHRDDGHRDTLVLGDVTPGDGLPDVIQKVFANESLSLSDTREVLDVAALGRAVALIAAAPRVDLFGVGAGAVVLHDFQQKLSRIGRTALHWQDNHAAWTAAAALPPGTVVVGVSHSGETPATVDFLRIARDSGAATIALTNHDRSPLCEHADVTLQTAAREAPFRSGALGSRMAQLMVLDCLFIGVAHAAFDDSMAALASTYAVTHRR